MISMPRPRDIFANEKCTNENLITEKWIYPLNDSFFLAIFACEVKLEKLAHKTKKKLILIVDQNFNDRMLHDRNFVNQIKLKGLKFAEFEEQGFCVCDQASFYFNNCRHDLGSHIFLTLILIFAMVIISYIIFELFSSLRSGRRVGIFSLILLI
jgi:hypothetical protein